MRRARIAIVLCLLLAGCGGKAQDDGRNGAAADQSLPGRLGLPYQPKAAITVEREGYEAGPTRFSDGRAFREAAAAFGHEAHAVQVPVHGIPGAIGFRVGHDEANRSLATWQSRYVKRGAYVFRYDDTAGFNGGRDGILVLPTRDQWAVVRAAATNGVNYDILTPAIVRWLQRLNAAHPFTITGAGIDFVEGWFAEPLTGEEARRVARRMYAFDPDIVDQGTGTVAKLADELEQQGTLYLWWD